MEINVGNVYTKISGFYPEKLIKHHTSYMMPNAWFSPKYKQGYWDGRVNFAKVRKDHILIPTGFLSRLTKLFDEMNFPYTLFDERVFDPPEPTYMLNDHKHGFIWLDEGRYAYQGWTLDQMLAKGRGIIKIAPGGGKTEIAAALIKSLQKKTIWITDKGQLALQTKARLEERLEEKVGLFGYGYRDIRDITILMVQSAEHPAAERKLLDEMISQCEVVIGDEIHHLEGDSRKQWYSIFERIKAPWRFGLSGTPRLTGPGLALLAMTEDIIVEINAGELIERLVLAQPKVWWIKVDDPIQDKAVKWATAYKLGVVYNRIRNNSILNVAKQFKEERLSTLTLVQRINHGQLLADLLCYKGVRTEFLSGKNSIDERGRVMERLRMGELDHVVAQTTAGFGEGADYPFLRSIINATGFSGGGDASEDDEAGRVTKQILGRGLRRSKGKTFVHYTDFIDSGHHLLKRASSHRYGTLIAEGYEPHMNFWKNYFIENSK